MSNIDETVEPLPKYRLGKLKEAIKLVQKPQNREEYSKYNDNLTKGISLFNQLCLSANLTPDDKLDIITAYIKNVPDCGQDMLIRWRDMLPFLRGKELEDLVDLLVKVTKSQDIDSHQRMATAVTLYNNCFLEVCYGCFAEIACDRTVMVKYRVDASRYLFGAGKQKYKQLSQEPLIEIIDTNIYPSEYRYEIIAGFISRTGINSIMNMKKIRVPYNEEFVYSLQTIFFYNEMNGVRERILSGQHLMQMECVEEKERTDIGDTLLNISKLNTLSENTRADAADVVLRLGTESQKENARQIITELGFSGLGSGIIGSGSLLDRTKTIYTDSQNIHAFGDQVDRFIEKIIKETTVAVRPYHEIHQEVSDKVRELISDTKIRFNAFKALNRISIDTARFTAYKVTLAEIFVHVWIRIQSDLEGKEELEKRMIEELIDMGDTCSSGHSGRFVNVLATRDVSLRISWSEQIKTNMVGRMNARIRDCPDPDLRGKLAMAQSDLADDEDRIAYTEFIRSEIPKLKDELYKEFVGDGYVSSEEFEKAFEKGIEGWML